MRKAYSLIEAVVAIGILSIIISVGVSIIFVSSDTENVNKDLLLGNVLALEGAEAMKNIYYTNVLKYGEENAEDCGFVLPGLVDDEGDPDVSQCTDENKFYEAGVDRFYRVNRVYQDGPDSGNDILTWELSELPSAQSIIDDGDLDDDDSDYRLAVTEDAILGQIYSEGGDTDTKYYREIMVSSDGTTVEMISRVHWILQSGTIRTVESSFSLPI